MKKDALNLVRPKRPPTAYFLFLADFRIQVKDIKLKEGEKIPCLAAKEWQKMTDEEKKPYTDKLAVEWKKYEGRMAEYKKQVLLSIAFYSCSFLFLTLKLLIKCSRCLSESLIRKSEIFW